MAGPAVQISHLGFASKKGEVAGVRMLRGHGEIERQITGRKFKVIMID